jgi:hypothetical protein
MTRPRAAAFACQLRILDAPQACRVEHEPLRLLDFDGALDEVFVVSADDVLSTLEHFDVVLFVLRF